MITLSWLNILMATQLSKNLTTYFMACIPKTNKQIIGRLFQYSCAAPLK